MKIVSNNNISQLKKYFLECATHAKHFPLARMTTPNMNTYSDRAIDFIIESRYDDTLLYFLYLSPRRPYISKEHRFTFGIIAYRQSLTIIA